ncbi:MAG: TetR/AcrR family transcriptional regulator [Gammaproteobacteria bacterium]|nr:TetR/AcrR family transcriptional regulator [Gammaproteobacteria bacterium]
MLKAAIEAVSEFDIAGATVERICAQAGASRGLIAHYFSSKEELLLAALNALFDESLAIKQAIADDNDFSAIQKIRSIAHSNFKPPVYSWQSTAALQAFTNASRYNSVFAVPIRRASIRFRQMLKPLFEMAAKERQVTLDSAHAAFGLYIFTDGLWNSLATGKDEATLGDAMELCDLFIRGCLSKESHFDN